MPLTTVPLEHEVAHHPVDLPGEDQREAAHGLERHGLEEHPLGGPLPAAEGRRERSEGDAADSDAPAGVDKVEAGDLAEGGGGRFSVLLWLPLEDAVAVDVDEIVGVGVERRARQLVKHLFWITSFFFSKPKLSEGQGGRGREEEEEEGKKRKNAKTTHLRVIPAVFRAALHRLGGPLEAVVVRDEQDDAQAERREQRLEERCVAAGNGDDDFSKGVLLDVFLDRAEQPGEPRRVAAVGSDVDVDGWFGRRS